MAVAMPHKCKWRIWCVTDRSISCYGCKTVPIFLLPADTPYHDRESGYFCSKCWLWMHKVRCGCGKHQDFVVRIAIEALRRTETAV